VEKPLHSPPPRSTGEGASYFMDPPSFVEDLSKRNTGKVCHRTEPQRIPQVAQGRDSPGPAGYVPDHSSLGLLTLPYKGAGMSYVLDPTPHSFLYNQSVKKALESPGPGRYDVMPCGKRKLKGSVTLGLPRTVPRERTPTVRHIRKTPLPSPPLPTSHAEERALVCSFGTSPHRKPRVSPYMPPGPASYNLPDLKTLQNTRTYSYFATTGRDGFNQQKENAQILSLSRAKLQEVQRGRRLDHRPHGLYPTPFPEVHPWCTAQVVKKQKTK